MVQFAPPCIYVITLFNILIILYITIVHYQFIKTPELITAAVAVAAAAASLFSHSAYLSPLK